MHTNIILPALLLPLAPLNRDILGGRGRRCGSQVTSSAGDVNGSRISGPFKLIQRTVRFVGPTKPRKFTRGWKTQK